MNDSGFAEAMAILEGATRIKLTPKELAVWRLILEDHRVTDQEAREAARRVGKRHTGWLSVAVLVQVVDEVREERRLRGQALPKLPEPGDPAVAREYLGRIRQMLTGLGRKMEMPS